ncbi:MAG TPA: Dabb family protein [Planctomycetota bacterium]|nr:Dabb family protein [Planctomycetota bacterium]
MKRLCAALFLAVCFAASAQAADLVRHVVCLKFKEGTKPEEIKKIENAFRALKEKISDRVLGLEWGTNVSKENRDKGFTHCFVLTFADEKDVRSYAEHPDHKAFVALAGPFLDDIFVIDFHAKIE